MKKITWQSQQLNPDTAGLDSSGNSQINVPTDCNFWVLRWNANVVNTAVIQLEVDGVAYNLLTRAVANGNVIQSDNWELKAPIMSPDVMYTQNLILRNRGPINVLTSEIANGANTAFMSLSITRFYYGK